MIVVGSLLINPYQWPDEVWLIFQISLLFCALAAIIVLTIFISRIIKSYRGVREQATRFFFRGVLNSIIVQETISNSESPEASFNYKVSELINAVGQSAFRRNILIQQIIELRKNLSGSAADSLKRVYITLRLDAVSMKKLEHFSWRKKAMGLRELGEMRNVRANEKILKFLKSRNTTLRQEAFMALIRINEDEPLKFLNEYQNVLTPWMILNIHLNLQRMNPNDLPDFSKWLNHNQRSVKIFVLQMISQFRQLKALKHIVPLLESDDPGLVAEVLRVITELEGYQFRDQVIAIKEKALIDINLSVALLQCLARIGDPLKDPDTIASFLHHTHYVVRFEAVRVLRSFGLTGQQLLEQNSVDPGILKITNHLNEPLLQ